MRAELANEFAQVQRERSERLLNSDVPWQSQVWMAVAPYWTVPAARLAQFPTASPDSDVEDLFHGMSDQGFCSYSPGRKILAAEIDNQGRRGLVETPAVCSPYDAFSRAVIDRLTAQGEHPLRQVLGTIGERLAPLTPEDKLGFWAHLAKAVSQPGAAAQFLLEQVSNAVQQQHLAEAGGWIGAAEALQNVLPGELEAELRLAKNRLELAKRRDYDENTLGDFLERPDQIGAFTDFLNGPSKQWGLHYFGVGGVGKTMLLRHLQYRVLADATCARVDFDNLSPTYPSRAPGLLLLSLAEDLALFDRTGTARKLLYQFYQHVTALHEELSGDTGAPVNTMALIEDSAFQRLIGVFAEALHALPRPVVLMLDTCEELAKLQPDGTVPESVATTFRIFEELVKAYDGLRVVFSGRRPLASEGVGWSVVSHLPARSLPKREYLRLFEIRGFTRQEAEQYLSKSPDLKTGVRELIIERSPAEDPPSLFAGARTSEVRFNPFELYLFRRWAEQDPNLATTLNQSNLRDPYVELRIIGRLEKLNMQESLSAAALLRQFNAETLEAVLSQRDPAGRRAGIAELSQQEWIAHEWPNTMRISSRLAERLLAGLRRSSPETVDRVAAACADALLRLTTKEQLSRLEVSWFEALVRLLANDPDRLVSWWHDFAERIRSSQNFAYAEPVCQRLLGSDTPDALAPIRASVAATWAAALIRRSDNPLIAWAEVEKSVSLHPSPLTAAELSARVVAGRVSAFLVTGVPVADMHVAAFWELLDALESRSAGEQLSASLTAALEALVEYTEANPSTRPMISTAKTRQVQKICRSASVPVRAFLQSLVGRLSMLENPGASPIEQIKSGMRLLDNARTERSGPWYDWVAPEDLKSRLKLEYLRAAYGRSGSAARLAKEGLPLGTTPDSLDADRLASATLSLEQADRTRLIRRWTDLARRSEPLRPAPRRRVHARYPPLWAVHAEALAGRGYVSGALQGLREHSGVAEAAASLIEDVRESERACARIARTMRLDGIESTLTALRSSPLLEDKVLLWELQSIGPRPPLFTELEEFRGFHALWSIMPALTPSDRDAALQWARRYLAFDPFSVPDRGAAVALYLDGVEVQLLRDEHIDFATISACLGDWQAEPLELCAAILRVAALAGVPPAAVAGFTELVNRVGRRAAATIARREGEFLYPRLPRPALGLLRYARQELFEIGDRIGGLLAQAAVAVAACAARESEHRWREEVVRIKRAYVAAWRVAKEEMPPWSLIVAVGRQAMKGSEVDVKATLEQMEQGRSGWFPWALRIAACLSLQLDSPPAAQQLFIRVVMARSGVTSGGTANLPKDFQLIWGEISGHSSIAAAPGKELHIRIRAVSPQVSLLAPTEVQLEGPVGEQIRIKTPTLAPYPLMRQAIQPQLSSLAASIGTNELEIQLDPQVAWLPWEAILAPESRRVLRCVERSRIRQSQQAYTAGSVLVLGSMARSAPGLWNRAVTHGEKVEFDPGFDWPMPSPKYSHMRILHVLAPPVPAGAGVRLSLRTAGSGLDSESREGLIKPTDIVTATGGIVVCLLQTLVTQKVRTTYERTQSCYLRSFAAELLALGVPAVIVLPPIASKESEPMLERIARCLLTIGNTVEHIPPVLEEIRAELSDPEEPFDLCLYGQPRVKSQ